MALTCRGVMCAATAVVALAASLLALGVTADFMAHSASNGASWRAELKSELKSVTWWQVTVLACTSVASLAALLLLAFQLLLRCCCSGPRSAAGVLLALTGCLAHTAAFVAFTVYLATDFAVGSFGPVESWGRTLGSYLHKKHSTAAIAGAAAAVPTCLESHNAFDCYSSWPAKWQAMWTFGLVVGTAFWLLTLLLAALDRSAASRRQVADVPHATDTILVDEALLRTHGKAPKQQQFVTAV